MQNKGSASRNEASGKADTPVPWLCPGGIRLPFAAKVSLAQETVAEKLLRALRAEAASGGKRKPRGPVKKWVHLKDWLDLAEQVPAVFGFFSK